MKLEVKDITKSFGEKKVLKGISLQAESGMALGLLGRNGAGKTTTIRILMGLFPSDSGSVLLDGKPIDRNKLKIGYLPEERGLYPKKLISEQLIYLAALRGMSRKDAKKSIEYWLKRLEMQDYLNKKLDTLSKGNQQKIQLAATLMTNPDIVILDEPFSGLDPVNAMLLKDTVKELIQNGKVVVFSSHQMNYIEEFCENIAIINNGNIVLSGNIKAIKRGYDRSKIIIGTSEQEKVVNALKSKLSQYYKKIDARDSHTLIVSLKSADMKNNFLSDITGLSLDIDELKVYEPSLNDIFVEYTEGKI